MNILENHNDNYKRWAEKKLSSFTGKIDDLMVEINNPEKLSKAEKDKMFQLLGTNNIVFFNINNIPKDMIGPIKKFASSLGLGDYDLDSKSDIDGLTEIKVYDHSKGGFEYIPYSDKPLKWHTDGYYNTKANSIYSWLLYCVNNSKNGGLNRYMDHEIAYILYNKMYKNIADLMDPKTYTIPKNEMNNREEINNSIFSFHDGRLHMKFSMRERNILWNNKIFKEVDNLKKIIETSDEFHISHRFLSGQGVITNNVIHMRTAFTNSENKNRLLYRLRSKKRVGG